MTNSEKTVWAAFYAHARTIDGMGPGCAALTATKRLRELRDLLDKPLADDVAVCIRAVVGVDNG